MSDKTNIYIVISQTPTRFGKCLRKFGNLSYNHAAIGLDSDLSQVYAFARPQHNSLLDGHLVRETLERYTLRKAVPVPVAVFKLDVTPAQYCWVKETVNSILNDPEYMYNLISVLSYPITKGFETYKAYSCIEFVAYILNHLGYILPMPAYQCTPDDLNKLLKDKKVYEGDIRGRMANTADDGTYFAPMTSAIAIKSVKNIAEICRRSIFQRTHT